MYNVDEYFTALMLNKMMVKNLKLNTVQYKRKSMSPGLHVRGMAGSKRGDSSRGETLRKGHQHCRVPSPPCATAHLGARGHAHAIPYVL